MSDSYIRLNLSVRVSVKDQILRLMEETGDESMTSVIRQALKAYAFLLGRKKEGYRIILRKDDGTEREIELL